MVFNRTFQEALSADPAVHALLDEREALTAKLLDVDAALHVVAGAGGLPASAGFHASLDVLNHVSSCEFAQQWKAALSALDQDADAPLPE